MDDQLDDDLRNRIRDVFDDYNDGHADEGWLLLREKYPEDAKRRPVAWIWWGSVAASLLLLLGIFWYNSTPVHKQNLLTGKNQRVNYQVNKEAAESKQDNAIKNDENEHADSAINSLQTAAITENALHSKKPLKTARSKSNNQAISIAQAEQQHQNIINHKKSLSNKIAAKNNETKGDAELSQSVAQNPKAIAAKSSGKTLSQTGDASDTALANDSAVNAVKSIASVKQSTGINMVDETKKANQPLFTNDDAPTSKKKRQSDDVNKAVRFGIYEATYVNYAKGSNNQVNIGAGVSSDIKLSRNLNLSTGVSVAQNTFSYPGQVPPAQARLNAAASGVSVADKNTFGAATPTLKNYNANLVGLDVPVNLKYEFNPDKSTTYVSFGVSSGTFINETYTSTYNYNTPFASNLSQTADQSIHQSFNSFYFAKTLNFSLGTGYTVGSNQLIIEPFVKYPLEGLGSQQIKFGAGGLNLKFNIGKTRSKE